MFRSSVFNFTPFFRWVATRTKPTIQAIDNFMPPNHTNRLLPRSANEHGSTERIRALIGRDTPSLTTRITPGSVTPGVLAEADIEEDYDCENRIIDEDPLSDEESDHDDDSPEPNESALAMTSQLHHLGLIWWRVWSDCKR